MTLSKVRKYKLNAVFENLKDRWGAGTVDWALMVNKIRAIVRKGYEDGEMYGPLMRALSGLCADVEAVHQGVAIDMKSMQQRVDGIKNFEDRLVLLNKRNPNSDANLHIHDPSDSTFWWGVEDDDKNDAIDEDLCYLEESLPYDSTYDQVQTLLTQRVSLIGCEKKTTRDQLRQLGLRTHEIFALRKL